MFTLRHFANKVLRLGINKLPDIGFKAGLSYVVTVQIKCGTCKPGNHTALSRHGWFTGLLNACCYGKGGL